MELEVSSPFSEQPTSHYLVPDHTFPTHTLKNNFSIILSPRPRSSHGLFPFGFLTKALYALLFSFFLILSLI